MSALVRCDACKGKKRTMGMGMIYKDCKACSGLGWVEKTITTDEFLEAHEKLDEFLEKSKSQEKRIETQKSKKGKKG